MSKKSEEKTRIDRERGPKAKERRSDIDEKEVRRKGEKEKRSPKERGELSPKRNRE